MAHPRMFEPTDPLLGAVREIALRFPGADEKVSHGRPAFFTRKVFAYYGGSVRRGKDDWVEHGRAVLVLLDGDERAAVLSDERAFVPAYLGPSGWIGVDLSDTTDLSEIAELLDSSFRRTAPRKLVNELDQRG